MHLACFIKNIQLKTKQTSRESTVLMCRPRMAKPRCFIQMRKKNYLWRASASADLLTECKWADDRQSSAISWGANYSPIREEKKNDDAIADCGKGKDTCSKKMSDGNWLQLLSQHSGCVSCLALAEMACHLFQRLIQEYWFKRQACRRHLCFSCWPQNSLCLVKL